MGFLNAAGIGVAGVERIAKKLTEGKEKKEERAALLETLFSTKSESRFGVTKVVEKEGEE